MNWVGLLGTVVGLAVVVFSVTFIFALVIGNIMEKAEEEKSAVPELAPPKPAPVWEQPSWLGGYSLLSMSLEELEATKEELIRRFDRLYATAVLEAGLPPETAQTMEAVVKAVEQVQEQIDERRRENELR